ncbi:MAG: NADH-quinone oxidoreductase subunit J [Capsulimonadaceae bacterium]|nr:NADH-quinone oxidoreductase subunit J [Capsulimonadaceae bacterium]
MGTQILFAILAAVAVVCGIGVVVSASPVRSALNLVLVLCSVALLYLTLNASFVAAIQIIVYAGAIMVLFLFVVMILNLGSPEPLVNKLKPQTPLAVVAGLVLIGVIASVVASIPPQASGRLLPEATTGALTIGLSLFSPAWVFPFEAVSVLLLVATVGAVVLATRRAL